MQFRARGSQSRSHGVRVRIRARDGVRVRVKIVQQIAMKSCSGEAAGPASDHVGPRGTTWDHMGPHGTTVCSPSRRVYAGLQGHLATHDHVEAACPVHQGAPVGEPGHITAQDTEGELAAGPPA